MVVVALTRYVSLGSVVGAISFPILLWLLEADPSAWMLGSTVAIAVLIVVKHRSNLQRLVSGTENKLGAGKSPPETG